MFLLQTRLLIKTLCTVDEELLLDFLGLCRPANFNQCNQIDLCDGLLGDLTSNIRSYKYYNIDCKILKSNSLNSLMWLRVNIRSLHKNYDLLYELIEAL